jgi:polysaccharide pyruvyl transferase WcaK-like protein
LKSKAKLLLGYYGAGNLGDELILRQYLKENKDEKYTIFSYGYDYTKDNVVKTYYWKQGDKYSNIKSFIFAIKNVDEVIWVGGTCFTDEDGDGAFKFMLLAKLFFKKIKYINIGINNLKYSSRIRKVRLILTLASYISVRDKESFKNAQKYKISFFSKNNLSNSIEKDLGEKYLAGVTCGKDGNNLMIAWRTLNSYIEDENLLINELIQHVKTINNQFSNVFIINTDSTKDVYVSEYIYNKLKYINNIIYLGRLDTDEKLDYICNSSFIITSRLHVGVMAYLLNKNTYVYNYSNKIEYYYINNENKNYFKIFNSFRELV